MLVKPGARDEYERAAARTPHADIEQRIAIDIDRHIPPARIAESVAPHLIRALRVVRRLIEERAPVARPREAESQRVGRVRQEFAAAKILHAKHEILIAIRVDEQREIVVVRTDLESAELIERVSLSRRVLVENYFFGRTVLIAPPAVYRIRLPPSPCARNRASPRAAPGTSASLSLIRASISLYSDS